MINDNLKNDSIKKVKKSINSERLLSRKEVAEFLGISKGTLDVWACTKRYPLKFVKIGKCVRYKESDVLNFVDEMTKNGCKI